MENPRQKLQFFTSSETHTPLDEIRWDRIVFQGTHCLLTTHVSGKVYPHLSAGQGKMKRPAHPNILGLMGCNGSKRKVVGPSTNRRKHFLRYRFHEDNGEDSISPLNDFAPA